MNLEEIQIHEKLIRELRDSLLELQKQMKESGDEGSLRISHILEMQINDWQRELEFAYSEKEIAQRGQPAAEIQEVKEPKEETKQPEQEKLEEEGPCPSS